MKVMLAFGAVAAVSVIVTIMDHIHAVHAWMYRPAPVWATSDLFRYLKVVVPVLGLVHLALTWINWMQQRNSTQRSLTRFMASKALFWGVVEFSLYHRATNLWVLMDFTAFTIALIASTDTLVRLFMRYALGRVDQGEVLP